MSKDDLNLGDIQPDKITGNKDKHVSFLDLVMSKFGGDKFIPAFAGYFKDGYNRHATSIMLQDDDARIQERPDLGVKSSSGYSFEPLVTAQLKFKTHETSQEPSVLDLPSGVIPIFGVTGSGKSTMATYLTTLLKARYVRFGEPEIPSIHDPKQVLSVIHDFLNNDEFKFLVIDSFRPFMFLDTEKASMGKGGVNNALYMDFTALSSLATWAGKTILIVINPLAFNKDDVETVRSNLESSTVGMIHTLSYGSFTFVSRTSSNNRKPVTYITDYKNGIAKEVLDKIVGDDISIADLVVTKKLDYKSSYWNKIYSEMV